MSINTKNIKKEDYDLVRELDGQSFQRDVLRSNKNIENLCANHPEGCFIGWLDKDPMGYVISHQLGEVGYIGPMGIKEKHHNQGYGQELIKSTLEVLVKKCKVIGLETFSSWGKNIAFFHRLGFRETFPGRIMTRSVDLCFLENNIELRDSFILGKNMNKEMKNSVLKEISKWGNSNNHGIDLSSDVAYFLKYYPDNILFFYDSGVEGFLSYHKDYNPFYLGAVKPSTKDMIVFKSLLHAAARLHWSTVMKIHFQTNFNRVTKILLDLGFHIEQDVSCLLYSDYYGNHFNRMDELVIRSWWG